MAIATGIALGIAAAAAGAGASIYGAKKASDAAKTASAQQQQSAQQALGLQQQQYQQTRDDLAPYRQQGGQGLTALSAYLGLPTAPQATPGMGDPFGAGQRVPPTSAAPVAGRALPPGTIPLGQAVPRGPVPPTGGGTVLLRAPNGQTQAVPADQADYYVARGATRG